MSRLYKVTMRIVSEDGYVVGQDVKEIKARSKKEAIAWGVKTAEDDPVFDERIHPRAEVDAEFIGWE